MKARMMIGAVLGCVLAGWPVWAGPVERDVIPAGAKWAVHFDVETIRGSRIGEGMMKLISDENSPVRQDKINKAENIWARLEDVRSLTFYGCTYDKKDAVVVAKLDYDKSEILEVLGIGSHEGHEIYSAGGKEHKWHSAGVKHFVCLYDATTIVASGSEKGLKEALDLLDGRGRTLRADQPLSKMLETEKGAFMVAAVQNVSEMVEALQEQMVKKGAGHGALLKTCQSLRLEVGELKATMFAKMDAALKTTEDAANVQQAAQGMLALGMLQQQENERLAELLRGIKIDLQGKDFSVRVELASDDILARAQEKLKQRADK